MEARFALDPEVADAPAQEAVAEALEVLEAVDLDHELEELVRADGERATLAALPTRLRATVDVVVVTHDSRLDLERHLDSIAHAARVAGGRLLVVDNASRDGTVEHVLAARPAGVELVALDRNRGYAGAVNAAAACSTADYLVILNPDIEPCAPDAVVRLVAHLESHPCAGAAAPRLHDPDGGPQASARVVPSLGMLLARQTPLGRTRWGRRHAERYLRLPSPEEGGFARPEWALGAALAVRREDFDALGGWDEGFFMYFEDVDFCTRLRSRGREVHYLPDVEMTHDHRRASDRSHGSARASIARRAHIRSALRFYAKHPRFLARPTLGAAGRAVSWATAAGRRAFDVVVAGLLVALFAPVMAIAALAIRLDSPGPILFRQRRLGHRGEEFTCLKFRSMRCDADHNPHAERAALAVVGDAPVSVDGERPVFKLYPDPRVTRVGDVLRRWSLDELPQLFNVLRGDMTLVGFRPPIPYEIDHYPHWYHRRFAVKPGLTGIWQVSGRNERSYEEMVRFDIEYVNRRSWLLDLALLVRTVPAVARRRGAY
ncbi:MAG: hypothetical protein QOI91_2773 [Solirubrobacteraceae bacterium]|jgi:lipopolysaccharide/colanic/teichoic acid biosynthesis glycosyltransferase|nr:hypothetical protein [Solirubrobacteraceae bacterium]